jgi:hypothetical protein
LDNDNVADNDEPFNQADVTVTVEPVSPPTFDPRPNQFDPPSGWSGRVVTLKGNNFNVGTPAVFYSGPFVKHTRFANYPCIDGRLRTRNS